MYCNVYAGSDLSQDSPVGRLQHGMTKRRKNTADRFEVLLQFAVRW